MNNSIQDEFIATVSHELRTPLTSIRGFSQTLLNSWDKIKDDDKKKFIKIIEEQSNRLIHLVENVLSVSKTNSDNVVLKQINVNELIKKVLIIFIEHYKNINFETKFCTNLPPARFDEDKLQQVMTNLIDNAVKYSGKGKNVKISTEIENNMILIKVIDEGVGIKKEDFGKIFQKFSRIENYLTSSTQGNGLGLYITKQIVEKLGGQINFESKLDIGTTFIVKIPIYNQEEALKCSRIS